MYEVGKSILNLMLLISTVWIIYRVLGTFFEKRKWTVLSWISWGILIAFQQRNIYIRIFRIISPRTGAI